MSSVACPKCGRTIAAAAGATSAQCFGCGTTVALASRNAPSEANSNNETPSVALAALIGGIGLFVLLGAIIVLWVVGNPADQPTTVSAEPAVETPVNPPDETPVEEKIVVTDDQRRRAEKVDPSVRQQIIQMWDQMTSTTRRKVPAPKGSVARVRVEGLLGGIEQRELARIAALFNLDEEDVEAVIQVELANRQQP